MAVSSHAIAPHGSSLRVALFWPHGPDATSTLPLGLAYLKGNADDPRWDIRIFDCVLEKAPAADPKVEAFLREFRPHLVGVSAWSAFFEQALALLRLARRVDPQVITLVGGVHPTAYPLETMGEQAIDFAMVGEAEFSFPAFLDRLQRTEPDWSTVPGLLWRGEDGQVLRNPPRVVEDLDSIRPPDYDFIDLARYLRRGYRVKAPSKYNAPIWATRGCPYRCNFCSAPVINGKRIRRHSIAYLMDWVQRLYHQRGIRWINIIDDNFSFDLDYAKEFCRAVIALGLPGLGFGTSNGIRMQRGDSELWSLMKQAGWRTVIVAPESGSAHTLKLMRKDLDPEIVPPIVDEIRRAGLIVHGFFMIGYPGETAEDLEQTARFIARTRFSTVMIQRFLPLPGTPIYEQLVAAGKIPAGYLPDNYSCGQVKFVDDSLKDFDFPRYILRVQLRKALQNPWQYFLAFKNTGKGLLIGSLAMLVGALLGKKQESSLPKPGLQ